MILSSIQIVGKSGIWHLQTRGDKILLVSGDKNLLHPGANELSLSLDGAIAFPGLVNSHDHLDFNLFPQLGNHIYSNYIEWGEDIHRQNKEIIANVLKIPAALRIRWGIYKNLLNGITTVVNHGQKLEVKEDLISIYQSPALHSTANEKSWKWKLNLKNYDRQAVVIHIGEGTDSIAGKEIDTLIRWNIFRKKLIGVHGVAMNKRQASFFEALIWCPDSNFFLLGKTAAINQLKDQTKILFGTDSTVSACWNLWSQLRLAREQQLLTDHELYVSLTETPVRTWRVANAVSIDEDEPADLVVARPKQGSENWDQFYQLDPEDILLVVHKGNIRMFDKSLHASMLHGGISMKDYYRIAISKTVKYVQGDLPALVKEIKKYYPGAPLPVTIP